MALGTFVAGRYSSTWNSGSLGLIEKGYRFSFQVIKDMIANTDAYAGMVIDAIYQGITNVFVQANSKEWTTTVLAAVTPYSAMVDTGAGFLGPGVIGRLDTGIAQALVLTATTGTAAASSPATMTATYSILAENFNVEWLLGPEHRIVPIRFRIYPYDDTGTIKYLTVT